MTILAAKPVILVIICAAAYALAALAMKETANTPHPFLYVVIALCFAVAAVTEIMVLRHHSLGITYIAIIGAESVLVITLAGMIGEGLSPREMAGAALVLVGTLVLGT